jgi:hypothetical protein
METVPVPVLAAKIHEERNIKIVPPRQDLKALARVHRIWQRDAGALKALIEVSNMRFF